MLYFSNVTSWHKEEGCVWGEDTYHELKTTTTTTTKDAGGGGWGGGGGVL